MLRYLDDVVTLEMDENACTGCGVCLTVCPHAVFARNGGGIRIVDRDACMECGACARNCPSEALRVEAGVGCATGLIVWALGGTGDCCGDNAGKESCCG